VLLTSTLVSADAGLSELQMSANSGAPRWRETLVEEGSTQRVVDCAGSDRAAWSGNWLRRSPVTKAALGGWASMRAVTRVKP